MGAVSRDFVDDTRQQFNSAGQAIRDTTDRLVGTPDYRTQPADYRSQGSAPSTMPAGAGNVRYTNQPTTDTTGLNDPGRNPFQAGTNPSAVNGPALNGGYRNQAQTNPTGDRSGGTSQSPFNTAASGTNQDGRYAGNQQQSNQLQAPSIDNWQYQDRTPELRNDNAFAAGQVGNYSGMNQSGAGADASGQANNSFSRSDAWANDPWTNSRSVGNPQQGVAGGQAMNNGGQPNPNAGPQLNGVNFPQSGQNPQLGANDQTPAAKPWGLMFGTGVALIGSLGANLFLGFSFLDARHKYLSAIRRGARSTSRVEG
jgi:hypothetical protein